MRLVNLVLCVLIVLIQYPLWMGQGGWFAVWELERKNVEQRAINEALLTRNVALEAEVQDLREGTEAIEERARSLMGMMRNNEVFVQIVPDEAS